jgi:tetratricopeptide (TPR) repeat protein
MMQKDRDKILKLLFTNSQSHKNRISRMRIRRILLLLSWFTVLPFCSFSQSLAALIQSGQNYLRKGQYVDALEQLNFAILKEPASSELFYLRGYAKFSLDDYIGAEEDYDRSIGFSPFQAEVFVNRAIVRCERLNYNGAFEDLANAQKLDSTNADIYFNLGRIKLILKKYYASISDCNTAIRLGYQHESIYLLRGSSEWGLKRTDNAISDLKKAIEINPANSYSYVQLGSIWLDQNHADSAIICFDKAIRLDSNNVYALFNRALARVKVPDQPGAMKDLDKVIRLSPYNSYAYFNRAILFIDRNEKMNAIRDFTSVIKLNPKNIVSYYYRGMLETDLREYRNALEDLDKTIELSPEYADAYYARFQVRSKLKDMKGAKEDYKMAYELGKKNHFNPDSLTTEKKDYLQSLVKLSGDFEEMNTMNGKFQNQPVSIQLMPMFLFFFDKAPYPLLRFYDSYPKEHYHTNILGFTTHDELFTDSLCRKGITRQTRLIDSVSSTADLYLKRATYYSALNLFNEAFRDLDSALKMDSGYVLAYFIRANTRFGLIRLMHSLDTTGNRVTINKNPGDMKSSTGAYDAAYDSIIADYSKALSLDPGFAFAWYNRGLAFSRKGEFQKASDDFSKAIGCLTDFAEAFYNRGLISILLNDNLSGCEDLSRAGELGILDAYRVIKRTCYK